MKNSKAILVILSLLFVTACTNEVENVSEATSLSKVESVEEVESQLSEREKLEEQLIATPDAHSSDWNLILVNNDHILTEDLDFEKFQSASGEVMDARIAEGFSRMISDGEAQGLSFILESGYRSFGYQQDIYNSVYNKNLQDSSTSEEAIQKTEAYIAIPGSSEHMTGLALDITEPSLHHIENGLIEEFEDTAEGQWLHSHAPEYGFVLRYPRDKEEDIDVNYESWHFRYVGVENAKYMQENDLVLEEYIEQLQHNESIRQAIADLEE